MLNTYRKIKINNPVITIINCSIQKNVIKNNITLLMNV